MEKQSATLMSFLRIISNATFHLFSIEALCIINFCSEYAEKIKETNEVQRFKQEREMHRSTLNKKVKTIDLNQEKNTLREDFDLRKAVIMSVILERPYK